jgi:ATP-dependent Clp protease ATP-binding subunit ClpC
VVVLSGEECRALGHRHIGTEHILLGLLRAEDGFAARALGRLDITIERVRPAVVRIVGTCDGVVAGQVPFTPRAKKVLELALREALNLGHNYIGSEHILLGLVRENEGVAAGILSDFGADADKIRNEIIRMMGGPGGDAESAGGRGLPAAAAAAVRRASAAQAFPDVASMSRDELERAIDDAVDQLFFQELDNASRRSKLRDRIDVLRAERGRRRRSDDDDPVAPG